MCVFVKNRVNKIKEQSRGNWNYVPTAENPADLGTRAIVPFKQGDLWTKGPTWLNNPEAQPKQPEILETEHTKSELAGK